MPDQTGLQQAIDNTGNPYPAVRVRVVQLIAALTASATPIAPFQPQTKVIRVCGAMDVVIGGFVAGQVLVAAGFFQDFIVYPTDALTVRGLIADGNVSVAELM